MPTVKYLNIQIFGAEAVRRQLFRGQMAAGNMRPVLEDVADDMMSVVGLNFSSEGRRGGGRWSALSPQRMKQKLKAGYPPEILIATGALHDSMTQRGDPDQYLKVTNNSINLSSYLPYAVVHTTGSGRLPKRDYTKILSSDRQRWVTMCENYLRSAMGF